MQQKSSSVDVPRLSKAYDYGTVHGAIVEAVQTLGYRHPTKEQVEVIEKLVSGRDVFVSLPTASGKSVCYACLPLVFGGGRSSVNRCCCDSIEHSHAGPSYFVQFKGTKSFLHRSSPPKQGIR